MKSLLQLFYNLFQDMKRLHPDVDDFGRDFLTIKARLEDEGVGFASVALPAFAKSFDLALDSGRWTHISGFSRNGPLPKFLKGLVSLVFDAKTGELRCDYSTECILSIRQICYICKKMLPSDSRNEHLEILTIKSFLADEASIFRIAPFRLEALTRTANLVLEGLDTFQELECRHGPGAVAEGYTANQKWSATYQGLLDFDPRLMIAGYDLQAMLATDPPSDYETLSDYRSSDQARLVTVPKSCSALRTITVEPLLNQFVQQGFNAWLRSSISRCPVLSLSLDLTDQGKNQELALSGSLTGDWCTIDLSSASDLLSEELVRAVFANRPRFLNGILACRTPNVKVGSNTITLKKYAGMGNATTFPVQSVVFTVIALTAMSGLTKELKIENLRRLARNVRIFGDDIIVRAEHFQEVASWIISCGLRINRGKTFYKGNFRESCGVDAIGGTDVTPVYLRHDPGRAFRESDLSASLVSTSNQLWLRGYQRTAEFIRAGVERLLGRLPLVRDDSDGIGWHTRVNAYTGSRWSRTLHRFEVRTYVSVPKRRADVLSDRPALFKFYHLPQLVVDDSAHLSTSTRRYSSHLRRRWVHA